jgi:4-amino-4-deoxy-L-arabinose transferase-like glycosyltransferase
MAVATRYDQNEPASASRLAGAAAWASRSHGRALAVLVLVALINFLPGFAAIPPIDRDEARYAQASKQMIETGDYVDIRFQDEVRYKKPVGIYWLQAGVVRTARALGMRGALTTIWLYRIPSLIGAVGAVLLTYWAALAFVARRAALLAGLMMAASILLGVEARLATTDAMLLAAIVAAMGALARVYLPERQKVLVGAARWTLPAIFWSAIALGVLLKGPLILLAVGLAAATLSVADRSARWLLLLKPLAGTIWTLALVLPWFVAIVLRSHDAFLEQSVGGDLLPKLFGGQEGHGAPPGIYFLLFWVTFWPGATLAALATPAAFAARREPGCRFLLAWLVPTWIVLELVVTKLPHYVMPLYPAIAILIAGIVEGGMLSRNAWLVRGASWWFTLPAILGVAAVVALIAIGHQLGLAAWVFVGAAMVLGLVAWRLYEVDGAEVSLIRGVAASLMLGFAVLGVVVPSLDTIFPSPALARMLRESGCAPALAASVGYEEPSLVFLAGTQTRLTSAAGAADFLAKGTCRLALVEQREQRDFAEAAEAIGLRYSSGARFEGINISNGQRIAVSLYRSEGSQ